MKKISRRFLLWFLTIALVPLVFFGYITARKTVFNVKAGLTDQLTIIAANKARHIKTLFADKEHHAAMIARSPEVIHAMEQLQLIIETSAIDSNRYRQAYLSFKETFTYFNEISGFYDFYLISLAGKVVFSVRRESEIGSNLLTGKFPDSELARSFIRTRTLIALDTSDFRFYGDSPEPAAFITVPILEKKLLGVLGVRIPPENINSLALDYKGLGQTGETVIASLYKNKALVLAPLRFDPAAAFKRTIPLGSATAIPVQEAVNGGRGSGFYVDFRQLGCVALFALSQVGHRGQNRQS